MAPAPLNDLTHLLAEVASRLSRPPGGESISASISSLAAALNPSAPASGTRALDAALSLMCFDPQEVNRARLNCLVRTIVSALSESVSCRVVRTDERNGGEMLCFGSSLSPGGCRELVRSCAALVDKLGDRDVAGHSYDLLHAVVKTALLSPRYRSLFPLPYYREDGETGYEMGTIGINLTRHPSYQVLPTDGSIPPRLMITNFPIWFSFATALLFHQEGSQGYISEILSREKTAESISDISLAQRAAFYLSWVLCPSNVDESQMLANNMVDLSHAWARNNKRRPSYAYHTSTVNHRRKLRIPTAEVAGKLYASTNPVSSLIEEFDDHCVKFSSITAVSQVQDEDTSDIPLSCPNFLHLQIPLGVLLVSSSCISEQDCNVLLHYTSTGLVLDSKEVQKKTKDHFGYDGFSSTYRGFNERRALSGAYLIFGWLDIIDDMSAAIFECEDTCRRFVSELRTKTCPYLLKCVNLLLNQVGQDKDFIINLRDRLLNWSIKGQSFDGCEAFKDVILQMNTKVLLLP